MAVQVEQLITEHLDLWTQAQTAKSTSGRGSNNKIELTGIKKLRELILELAVRGKLVPQDPNDEPASELLKRIAAEKELMVKAGKLKKQKPMPPISDEEKPFVLPVGWVWAKLPQVCTYKVGKTPSTKSSVYWANDADESQIPWVSISDLNHNSFVSTTERKITEKAVADVFKSEPASAGDILMSFKLTVGKVSILDVDAFHNEAIISVKTGNNISKNFLFKVLPARAADGNTKGAIKGKTLNSESIADINIPLPPLKEQHRIVEKVDELMALCDQLEQQSYRQLDAHNQLVDALLATLTQSQNADELASSWQRLAAHFDTLFTTEYSIDALKQTILQLAVMGKLVKQDPNDEPASELLKRIAAEKEVLVKADKIKKQKPLPPISNEEKPFELPEGWEWARLGSFLDIRGGKRVSNGYQLLKSPTPYIYIRVSDFKNESIDDSDLHYIDEKMRCLISKYVISKDDIYMTIVGATIGKCGIVPEKFDNMNLTENAARLILPKYLNKIYILKCLTSDFCQTQFLDKTKQVGVQKMALNKLSSSIIPIPPANEQCRIVAKVDELMTICDSLSTKLDSKRQIQAVFAELLVEQVVG